MNIIQKIIVNMEPGRILEELAKSHNQGQKQFKILEEKLHHLQQEIQLWTKLRDDFQLNSQMMAQKQLTGIPFTRTEQKKVPFKMLNEEFLKINDHSKTLIFDQFLLLINRVAQLMFLGTQILMKNFISFQALIKMKQVHFPFNCKPSQIMLSPLNSIQKKRSESLFMNDYSILKQPGNKSQSIILSTEKTTETDGVQNKIKRRLPKKLSSIVRERQERKNSLKNKIEEYETNTMKRSHIFLNYYDYFEMQKNQQNFERKVFKKYYHYHTNSMDL